MEYFDKLAIDNTRVIVFGDLMLDRYWHGETSRISPEAPVPVVKVNEMETRPGGGANVANNIATLGAKVALFGMVGLDKEASILLELLEKNGIDCQWQALNDFSTLTKLRVLSQNQQLIRLDFERDAKLSLNTEIMNAFEAALLESQAVILSDYNKGCLYQAEKLIQCAKQKNVPVLVDPKTTDFNRYRGATLLTPNRLEFELVVGSCKNEVDYIQRARQIMQDFDIEALLITLGKDGMLLIPKDKDPCHLKAHSREVYDVTGAGDTVIAIMGLFIAMGFSLEKAAHIANIAAGIAVRKLGAAAITLDELSAVALTQNEHPVIHRGVLTQEQLLQIVAYSRANKRERIVMTNGCFDIIHSGHVAYLKEAKRLGHRLIVAVNDDDSVRRLKGASRPLNTLSARMAVLAAMEMVDWVVPFSEDTPEALISAVLPDVLVKGGDYQVQHIAGCEAVIANGGDVKVLSYKTDSSTSKLVAMLERESV